MWNADVFHEIEVQLALQSKKCTVTSVSCNNISLLQIKYVIHREPCDHNINSMAQVMFKMSPLALDASTISGAEEPGFKSQPRRCRVTVLGKLFTPIVPLFTKQQSW